MQNNRSGTRTHACTHAKAWIPPSHMQGESLSPVKQSTCAGVARCNDSCLPRLPVCLVQVRHGILCNALTAATHKVNWREVKPPCYDIQRRAARAHIHTRTQTHTHSPTGSFLCHHSQPCRRTCVHGCLWIWDVCAVCWREGCQHLCVCMCAGTFAAGGTWSYLLVPRFASVGTQGLFSITLGIFSPNTSMCRVFHAKKVHNMLACPASVRIGV